MTCAAIAAPDTDTTRTGRKDRRRTPPMRTMQEALALAGQNIGLAWRFALKHAGRLGLHPDDALSACIDALTNAALLWNPERARLSTYAERWMRCGLARAAKQRRGRGVPGWTRGRRARGLTDLDAKRLPAADPGPLEELLAREEQQERQAEAARVRDAVAELTPAQRYAVEAFMAGTPQIVTARRRGTTRAAVSDSLHNGLAALRETLAV